MGMLNVLIIGNGHYATGITSISGKRTTDKDYGVLLPSVLALKSEGMISEVGIAARDGNKFEMLRERLLNWRTEFGWSDELKCFPNGNFVDDGAYKRALDEMPKPLVALIAVPDYLHKEVMIECIKRGVHFLVVKPAVINLKDLYEVLDLMLVNPVLGMVDYHKVFDEANILLKAEYESGAYGKINHVSSLMTQRRDMVEIYGRWFDLDPTLNINHYLGSHYIHLLSYLTKAIPLDVRATRQPVNGVADLIETQVRWKDKTGHYFTSYHISGWNDPQETESMTYQEIHLLCENGHIDSDQRFRGFRSVLAGKGSNAPNPYFFNFNRNVFGEVNFSTKYGFISIRTFIKAVHDCLQNRSTIDELDSILPTLRESTVVTAILEAADNSLKCDSGVVKVVCENGRLLLSDNNTMGLNQASSALT